MRDQDGAQVSCGERPAGALSASSPSKAPSTAGRWRRSPPAASRNISKASARWSTGFDQVPFGDLEAVEDAPSVRTTAAILIEPIRARAACAWSPPDFLRALRELCDEHGLLLIFDEVQTGMGRTGKLFAYQHAGVTPDIMALAKALGGGFPVGACLATAEAGQGHDGRHARLDLRRQSAGHGGRQRGARRHAGARLPRPCRADVSLLLKQRLAELKDRYPDGDRRGARRGPADRACAAVVPSGDLVDALRDEKLLGGRRRRQCRAAAAAADHQRGGDRRGVRRLERACAPLCRGAAERAAGRPDERQGRAALPRSDRHSARPSCAECSTSSCAMKAKRKREGARRRPSARRQDAGDDLREAVDPHPRVVRRRACASSAATSSC